HSAFSRTARRAFLVLSETWSAGLGAMAPRVFGYGLAAPFLLPERLPRSSGLEAVHTGVSRATGQRERDTAQPGCPDRPAVGQVHVRRRTPAVSVLRPRASPASARTASCHTPRRRTRRRKRAR